MYLLGCFKRYCARDSLKCSIRSCDKYNTLSLTKMCSFRKNKLCQNIFEFVWHTYCPALSELCLFQFLTLDSSVCDLSLQQKWIDCLKNAILAMATVEN